MQKSMIKFQVLPVLFVALALPFFAASNANADESGVNAVPGADKVDEVITNANLRALSGSKSRISISNSITYDGGTVSAPFAENRPNIANASATSTDTDLNDQLNIKLALNPFHSVMFGFGVRKMAPFTGSGPSATYYASGGKDVDFFDPALSYQYIYKFLGVQAVTQVGVTQYTRQDIYSSSGGNLNQNFGFDQENIYEIGELSIGGSLGFGVNTPTDSTQDYSHTQIWFDPYAEYKLTETLNLRTVFNVWSYEWYAVGGFTKDTWTQSTGVGISVTRDIFLYPNLQFQPQNMNWTVTNVGITATINLL